MITAPVTSSTLAKSVVAVPPLARRQNLSLDREENLKMVRHLEAGGIRSLLYGGNANFYHIRPSEFAEALTLLTEIAGDDTLMIPSVGPAYGVMMDQARILREFDFPTAMVLPQQGIATSAGVASGVRHFAEAYGKPVVLYIKQDGFIEVADAARLVNDGVISVIKYATVRENTSDDRYLRDLIGQVDPLRIMSGIGEQPAIIHLRDFGLGGFTSGCVCVAPKLSTRMLKSLQAKDYETAEQIRVTFRPLEDLRNAINPIRVLHEAVTLAGIGNMGPILPLLSNLEPGRHGEVGTAARALLEKNK